MQTVVDVPLNTMLADLDETLRRLLEAQLRAHGFDGVEVAFDAPSKEWAAALSGPAVNLFLYDIREAARHRQTDWEPRRDGDRSWEVRPPLRVEAAYAVTAWSRAVEDEHRLLSQVLGILYAFPTLPAEALVGTLANGSQAMPLETELGRPRPEGKVDFWSAVGGIYKASIDYIVRASCESGTVLERGPEIGTHTLRVGDRDAASGTREESYQAGGIVLRLDGQPVADAWVSLAVTGAMTVTRPDGRFSFRRVPAGVHRLVVRSRDGSQAEGDMHVPGKPTRLILGPPAPVRAGDGN
jgi:hypothetical protein